MRAKLIGLVLGCGLVVAVAAPALACDFYHSTSAQSDQATTQQTAQSQPETDTGSN